MHACGHDSHTAMLLGTAKVLTQLREEIPGAVKLLFQPAEEQPPAGEEGGARMMVDQGVMENPPLSAVFALHVSPQVKTGQVSYILGNAMAAADRFRVVVKGKGSHAAMPWMGVDPVYVAAKIVDALQSIRSRETKDLLVVTVGSIHGGQRWNIIPDSVVLEGTLRTFDPEVRKRVVESFERIVKGTAEAHGATAEITLEYLVPVNRNDPALGTSARASLASVVGEGNILVGEPSTGMDDFAFFAQKAPGLYVDLGVRNEKIGAVYPIHNENFKLDEAALPLGVRALSQMALDYLRTHSGDRKH
jgi:amidohydrolase